MIIKTKKAGINYEFGVKIYTLIYIKLIMKKDLLNRTGNSPEQTVITCMGKKRKRKRIDVYV